MAVAKANAGLILWIFMFIQSGLGVVAIKMFEMQTPGDRLMKLNSSCDGSGLSSRVVRPSDTDYDTSRSQFASIMASSVTADARLRPSLILFCTSDSHVQEAVQFANSCGFKVSVRSGGHNYAAASSCTEDAPNCIQVDLSGLETFVVDTTSVPNRVTLGVGLTLLQTYTQLAAHGMTVPGGVCQTVGVGGHYQSSAHGYLAKALGLGIDVMLSARMVLADGLIHTVDETSDPELWWALRGGGPGSWGIALDYTIKTFADVDYPHVKTFTFMYPYTRPVLNLLGSMFTSLSMDQEAERDMTYAMVVHPGVLLGVPGSTNEHYILIRAVWIGIDNGELTGALYNKFVQPWDDIPHLTFGPVMSIPLSQLQVGLASSWYLGPYRYSIHAFAMKSYPDADFYSKVADELDVRVAIPNFQFSFQIWGWGGAQQGSQTNRNAGINAYTVRDALAWVDDWVFFLTDDLAAVAEERIHAFREATGHHWQDDNIPHSWMTPDTLVNNTHSSAVDFAMNESMFARLQATKNRIDPADRFHASMTIPTSGSAFQGGVAAVGDPHLQNVHGEHFDVMQPGKHTLLEIPRRAAAESVLLLVEAEARHDGLACADVYFQALNITGRWPEAEAKGGLRLHAHDATSTGSEWMSFGGVSLKVTRGHTEQGTRYLNFYVKHLSKTGFAIGGLLGEDDHEIAATPVNSCQKRLSLVSADASARATSRAEASLA